MIARLKRLLARRDVASLNYAKLNAALDELLRACAADEIDDVEFIHFVCEQAIDNLGVDRAGAWRLNEDQTLLTPAGVMLREGRVAVNPGVMDLRMSDAFWRTVMGQRCCVVEDIANDARTSGMRAFFDTTGAKAVILAQVRDGSGPVGVVGAGMTDGPRRWLPEEAGFVASLAGFVSVLWERAARDRLHAELTARTREIEAIRKRLSDVIGNTPGVFMTCYADSDARFGIDFISAHCAEIWERSAEEMAAEPEIFWRSLHPADVQRLAAEFADAVKARRFLETRWRIQTQSGAVKWLYGRAMPEQGGGTEGVVFNTFVIDVTEQIESERALAELRENAESANRRFVEAIEALPDGFVIYDRQDRLVICNEQYRRAYAHIADVIEPGRTFEQIIRTAVERGAQPEAVGREEEWLAERLSNHFNPRGSVEQELPDGRFLRIHESITSSGDIVGIRVDITELKRQQRRLEELAGELEAARAHAEHEALHDGLTGLPNRRHLDRRLAECVASADAAAQVFALHVDLDRFKHINDTLGHAAGDFVLKSVAEALRDAVSEDDFVGRIGGDEFIVICGLETDATRAESIARQIVAKLSEPVIFENHPCRFGASVGVASTSLGDAHALLINADMALYEAKRAGRNRVEQFTIDLQSRLNQKKRTADEILRGLENDEFEPFFQPQFDARSAELVGVEALARWRHPERGVLAPGAFLDVAEELNVIDQLDRRILRKSIEACTALAEAGTPAPKLSVNVSLERLRNAAICEEIAHLKRGGLRIAFELLETIYFDAVEEQVEWAIDRLRDLGVELEIDDFGSGRASIVSILKVRPHRLKIDRSLVAPIETSRAHLQLVTGIIDIALSQGIGVTAEGVETKAHAEILREAGCDTLQGYYFAAPMPVDAVSAFIAAQEWPGAPRRRTVAVGQGV